MKSSDMPEILKGLVVVIQDDVKREARISVMPRTSSIRLNEWQIMTLAKALNQLIQNWSKK